MYETQNEKHVMTWIFSSLIAALVSAVCFVLSVYIIQNMAAFSVSTMISCVSTVCLSVTLRRFKKALAALSVRPKEKNSFSMDDCIIFYYFVGDSSGFFPVRFTLAFAAWT